MRGTAAARAAVAAASAAFGQPGCTDAPLLRFGAIVQTGLDWTGRSPSKRSEKILEKNLKPRNHLV